MKLKKPYKRIYSRVFPDYRALLHKELKGMSSVLDIGCGAESLMQGLSKNFKSTGVDINKRAIDKSKSQKRYDKYLQGNILKLNFKGGSYDCVVALDFIEHLTKKEGQEFLKKIEKIASKKIIIVTPNGFFPQKPFAGNLHQIHKSGWSTKEMKKRGYKVIGINGPRLFRGELASFRFRPKIFWLILSVLLQPLLYSRPELAYHLFCIKNKE